MKSSAWYHKLWRKKADEYPVKDDAHASWLEMQHLLDRHLPVNQTAKGKKSTKSAGSTLVSMLGFILPAAAMIGTITFVAVQHPFKNKPVNKQHQQLILKKLSSHPLTDSATASHTDSITAQAGHIAPAATDTVAKPGMAHHKPQPGTGPAPNQMQPVAARPLQQQSHYSGGMVLGASGQLADTSRVNRRETLNLTALYTNVFFTTDSALHLGINYQPWPLMGQAPVLANIYDGAVRQPTADASGKSMADRDGITVNKSSANSNSSKNRNAAKAKFKKEKFRIAKLSGVTDSSRYNWGMLLGLNGAGAGTNAVLGLTGSYAIQPRWLLSTGVNLDINRRFNSTYPHASYSPRDSIPFLISDKRTALVLSVPLKLEYTVSKLISISAGPQISILLQQKRAVKPSDGPSAYILDVPNLRDTISHGKSIDSALNLTTLSRFNIGISGGVSLHFNRHIRLNAQYQQNITPYQFNNSYLGNSKPYYRSVQVGLHYQFGK